jgi:hypothetical protein
MWSAILSSLLRQTRQRNKKRKSTATIRTANFHSLTLAVVVEKRKAETVSGAQRGVFVQGIVTFFFLCLVRRFVFGVDGSFSHECYCHSAAYGSVMSDGGGARCLSFFFIYFSPARK